MGCSGIWLSRAYSRERMAFHSNEQLRKGTCLARIVIFIVCVTTCQIFQCKNIPAIRSGGSIGDGGAAAAAVTEVLGAAGGRCILDPLIQSGNVTHERTNEHDTSARTQRVRSSVEM